MNQILLILQISRVCYVKSYLQVWWDSDLCDSDGTMIESNFCYREKWCNVDLNTVEVKVRDNTNDNKVYENVYVEKDYESGEEVIRHKLSKFLFSTCVKKLTKGSQTNELVLHGENSYAKK